MYSLLLLVVASFLSSIILTPLVRNLARRLGWVDHPDHRKLHVLPIPRLGGVAIGISYLLAFAFLFLTKLKGGGIVWEAIPEAARLIPAVAVVFFTGLIDDIRGLRPWQKLCGQTAAALLAFAAGVHIHGFQGKVYFDNWWSIPVTVLWLLACTNAVNLIDGVDGLAAGIGLFAACTSLLAGLMQGNMALAFATGPLVGALLGFLRYNFNPATIFLGDSGSLVIGFMLGCFGVLWSQKSATLLGMTAPLMALAIPLLDTSLSIVRRFLRRQPIFAPDRGHIHHRLLDRGLTPRRVALILYACGALGAVASLLVMNDHVGGYAIVFFCLLTWMGVQHLGYVEFGTAGRMFLEGAFRRVLNSQLALQSFDERLKNAATPNQCWDVVQSAVVEFGFHAASLHLGDREFTYVNGIEPDNSWYVRIPISASDYLELTRTFGDASHPSLVTPFAETLRRTLSEKSF